MSLNSTYKKIYIPLIVIFCLVLIYTTVSINSSVSSISDFNTSNANIPTATTDDTNTSDIIIDSVVLKETGDLNTMIKNNIIRVLLVSSKTMYHINKGERSGLFYELMIQFEKHINQHYKLEQKHRKIHVIFIPVLRNELISGLLKGKGDIAVADIAITPKRKEKIDFSDPFFHNINEIVITGPSSPKIVTLEDLSGKEVFVRRSSSYWEYLEKLNLHFSEIGKDPMNLKAAPEELEAEDLMEMVNAGLIKITVVDEYKAKLWAHVLTDIVLHTDIPIKTGDDIAWMVRKKSPLLMKEINTFAKTHKQGTLLGNILINRYISKKNFLRNATSEKELQKFKKVINFFRQYSGEYELNYLLMMAMGYQESRLDQSVKSHVGAIGIMQLMPKTGKAMNVGNIKEAEANIHAGIKYHYTLINKYFNDPSLDEINRTLFTFAAYNAGPTRIKKMRQEAEKRGLNPNKWFNNVELVVAEKIGDETINYVTNIFKYYISYKLFEEKKEEKKKVKKSLSNFIGD